LGTGGWCRTRPVVRRPLTASGKRSRREPWPCAVSMR
jgi:hypothetical protein